MSFACTRSLADNALCGINKYGEGIYTAEGITALCEGLKESAVTSLKCAASSHAPMLAFVSAPINIHFACSHSIGWNGLGVAGGKAVAAALKDTQITKLE